MAREERARHMQMYPGWSARDNYAVHKKRKKRKVKQVQQEEQEDHEELDQDQSADDGEHLLEVTWPAAWSALCVRLLVQ